MSTLMSQNDRCFESIARSLCARLRGGIDVATVAAGVDAAFAALSSGDNGASAVVSEFRSPMYRGCKPRWVERSVPSASSVSAGNG